MKRSIFKTTAALAVVSFVVMTSAISARCTDGVSYTSEELDENLEELNRDMAVQGTTIDKSTLAGSYEDPKIAHPTESASSSNETSSGEKTSGESSLNETSQDKISSEEKTVEEVPSNEVPAKACEHSYESTIAEDATCTTPGIRVYICTVCDDSYTEKIPASGHGDLETIIEEPAGLFTKGRQITRCTACGEVIETTEIPSKVSSGIAKIRDFFRQFFS